jgi:hypothetical protein
MKPTFKFVLAIVILAAVFCTMAALQGCAWHGAKYTGLDADNKPFTIELESRRFAMGQEVSGFAAEFPGGYKVGFDASKSDPVKTMESFFQVLGPILQDYMERRNGMPTMRSSVNLTQ